MEDHPTITLDADVASAQADSLGSAQTRQVLNELVSRVEDLETKVSHLSEENADLKHENKTLKKKTQRLEDALQTARDDYDDLSEHVSEIEQELTVLTSRTNHMNDGMDDIENELSDVQDAVAEKQASLSRRIASCEEELGLEEWDSSSSIAPDASAIERFAEMPEELREEKISVATQRAVTTWNYFDDWSENVPRGKIITSGRLKQFLSAASGDTLEYSQVYRVMEAFDDNAPDGYKYIDADDVGKALVKEI